MVKFLEGKGYKCWKTDVDEWSTTKHFQRRVDKDEGFNASLCIYNDKLCINIDEHNFTIQGITHHNFTLFIVGGNSENDWCDVKIYGVRPEGLENKLDHLEKKLLNMWKAFNQ